GNAALALSRIGSKAAPAIRALADLLRPEETHDEVRRYAAEALEKMTERDLAAVIPELLQAIKNDKTSVVRQHCVYAFFQVNDLNAVGATDALTAVLDETDPKQVMVRYESARCLAHGLRDKAPEKAIDVLLQ